jgi:hypothetical protein
MNPVTAIDPKAATLSSAWRTSAPAPLDAEPCPSCGANPSQYHTGGPGCPVLRGPCRKCQAAMDAQIRADENRDIDEKTRRMVAALKTVNDPEKRTAMQRNPARRVKAAECFSAAHRICPDRSRPHLYCDHCACTDAGRRLYSTEKRSAA